MVRSPYVIMLLALPIAQMPEPFKKELMNKIRQYRVLFLYLISPRVSSSLWWSSVRPPLIFLLMSNLSFGSFFLLGDVHLKFTTLIVNILIQSYATILLILISLVLSFLRHLFPVVELDMPWDNSQVPVYGPTFKAWGEEEIETAMMVIKETIPLNKLAFVVLSISPCYSVLP